MPLSLAEEAALVVGIDPADRFQEAGVTARPRTGARATCASRWPTAWPCRSATATFDLVLSHAVIEHVADAPLYLRECARVLAPGGHVYLSTAPYLSFAGAHLPRLQGAAAAAPAGRAPASRSRRSGSWRGMRRGR